MTKDTPATVADELLPCPFCGGNPTDTSQVTEPEQLKRYTDKGLFPVDCLNTHCAVQPHSNSKDWNTRAALQSPAAAGVDLEKLKKLIDSELWAEWNRRKDAGQYVGHLDNVSTDLVGFIVDRLAAFCHLTTPQPDTLESLLAKAHEKAEVKLASNCGSWVFIIDNGHTYYNGEGETPAEAVRNALEKVK